MRNCFCRTEGNGSMSELQQHKAFGNCSSDGSVTQETSELALYITHGPVSAPVPHPRHLPSVTGSSLSDNHLQPSIYTCFTSSLYVPFRPVHLARWFMDPTLRNHSAQTESERRDENQFFSSAPTSTNHFSVVKQKLLTSAIYTPSWTCMWTSGVI